jgi:hypothetical protein
MTPKSELDNAAASLQRIANEKAAAATSGATGDDINRANLERAKRSVWVRRPNASNQ